MIACSVILPVWNAEKTVVRAAESILAQSFGDLELVIVDDGSTDASRDALETLAASDKRVNLISFEERQGVVMASNFALAHATGEFVARMDADDVAHPDKLKKQIALMRERPELDVASCGVRVEGCTEGFQRYIDWSNGLVQSGQIARERFIESPVVNPTALFRGEILRAFGGYRDVEWAEDYDLYLMLLDAGMAIAKVPEILFDWNDGESRLTRTDGRYSQDNFLRAKAHFLGRMPTVRKHGALICGAGPIGKRIGRFLRDNEGVNVHSFFEVNPRRIGKTIGGIPVLAQEEMKRDEAVLLSAVGLEGARDLIRGLASDARYEEGVNFFCVC